MNIGILEALLITDIALEADDITKQVNDIMGGSKAPAEEESGDQREEDLTKTDNLFDDINKDSPDENPIDSPQKNKDDAPDDASDDSNTDEDETDAADSDNPDDIDNDGTETEINEEDKSVFSDKNTLKENMIYFFNIIRSTITSLEESLRSVDDQETVRVINSVIQNLYNCKDILYKILTEQMESTPYEILTTKYITIKRIYDISCDMLEEHYKNNPKSKIKYKRFRNKTK